MGYTPLDELKRRLRKMVLVVGTGVSAATCPDKPIATWKGLLEDGVDFCEEWTQPSGRWVSNVKDLLVDDELGAPAHMVVEELKKAILFGKWLEETVGTLHVARHDPNGPEDQRSRLIHTLWSLRIPVLTTNYDTLLEDATGAQGVPWTDPAAVQAALTGGERRVVHLHGIWDKVESVILDPYSYGVLSTHAPTQDALKAIVYHNSLLFVGCGAGVGDPTFGKLRQYLLTTLGWSRNQHFLLARHREREKTQASLGRDPIRVIGYGDEHSDLEPFVRRELLPLVGEAEA